jgi:hypothetical protein
VVKDLSELRADESAELLLAMAEDVGRPISERFLSSCGLAIASHSNAGYGNDKLVVRYDPGRAKGQGDRPKPTLPAMIF